MTFDKWFDNLIADQIWFGPASMRHKVETFKNAAYKVYMQEVATGFKPVGESRRHVYNVLDKTPGDNKKVDWVSKALKDKETEEYKDWVPVTGEERQRRLAEYKALIDSMPMVNNFPRLTPKEKVENGEWLPVKHVQYPKTSAEELYIKTRHLEYIKANYEPRTGSKRPEWISEDEFNLQYDNNLL